MADNNPRKPSAEEQTIIDEVLSLYQCKPSDKSYSHYRSDAVFHDPVSIAQGLDSIKSQFNGMPKLFASSETQKCNVMESPASKKAGDSSAIVLNLTQHYVFKGGKTPEKTVNSKVTLQLDEQGMIKHHEEEWDHQPNKTADDGFMGRLQEWRKKASAKTVEAGVSSDPNKI
ncbi:hypothetical protein LTR37_006584 [Vermiconidia calcicola]|uniref:Uncharacterized protein n=1 Tax=Vermiconidia calcicola TaxID=1690605 RepID=A0ACC3NH06_9PEZI|nr:hypothetical protein LTR37_006584 [Vermiconidia calcicola]